MQKVVMHSALTQPSFLSSIKFLNCLLVN